LQFWLRKFGCAGRGIVRSLSTQSSFVVHMLAAIGVLMLAATLRCDWAEWSLLILCITGVLTAEIFNTALERMAKAVTQQQDGHIRDALDMASGAVLIGAIGSAAIGLLIFGRRLAILCGYWPL
jgi:diacylglycerol kinase